MLGSGCEQLSERKRFPLGGPALNGVSPCDSEIRLLLQIHPISNRAIHIRTQLTEQPITLVRRPSADATGRIAHRGNTSLITGRSCILHGSVRSILLHFIRLAILDFHSKGCPCIVSLHAGRFVFLTGKCLSALFICSGWRTGLTRNLVSRLGRGQRPPSRSGIVKNHDPRRPKQFYKILVGTRIL